MTTGDRTTNPDLSGTWRKAADAPPCADRYPATLSFGPGTYRGTRGEEQGFIWWDAGTYRVEDATQLRLSVATDELVNYEIRVDRDLLTVVDPDGCRFTYLRVEPPG
jgi:hypothetical protein